MSIIDAWFTFLFNVCLPTWDVYKDVYFAFTLIQPICNDYYEPWQYFVEKHKWKSKQYFLTEYLFGQYISKHNLLLKHSTIYFQTLELLNFLIECGTISCFTFGPIFIARKSDRYHYFCLTIYIMSSFPDNHK